MSKTLFKWIEENAPGHTKELFNIYKKALDGTMRNPFQWKAIQFALETEFSKATQKTELSGNFEPIQVIIKNADEGNSTTS